MTALLIPTTPTPSVYSMSVQLDGTTYILAFFYNDRTSTWDMQIQDAGGNVLVDNVAMVPNYPLNYRFAQGQSGACPPGMFCVIDDTSQNRTPDNTNFGMGVNLYYNPVTDIEAL